MSGHQFTISIMRCSETRVYIGTSEDIPGLTLESGTIGEFLEAAMEIVPNLLVNNVGLSEQDLDDVTVKLVERDLPADSSTSRKVDRSVHKPHPRYLLDTITPAV